MAYLHCHAKGCGWSQDDFYSKNYNPITKIVDNIKWLWKPRMIEWDYMFKDTTAKELMEYTNIKVVFTGNKCFSWSWLLLEIANDLKATKNMKWFTYKMWKNDLENGNAKCPRCGKTCFDID